VRSLCHSWATCFASVATIMNFLQFCKCNTRVWGSRRRRTGHVNQHNDAEYVQQLQWSKVDLFVHCSASEMLVSVYRHLGTLCLLTIVVLWMDWCNVRDVWCVGVEMCSHRIHEHLKWWSSVIERVCHTYSSKKWLIYPKGMACALWLCSATEVGWCSSFLLLIAMLV